MKATIRTLMLSMMTLSLFGGLTMNAISVVAQDDTDSYAVTVEEDEVYELVIEDEDAATERAVMIDDSRVAPSAPRIGVYGRIVSNGMRVDRVNYDSVAYDAGLERGDVIMKINGRRITSMATYRRALQEAVDFRDGRVTMTVENIRWHTGESSQRYVNQTIYLPVPASDGSGGFGG